MGAEQEEAHDLAGIELDELDGRRAEPSGRGHLLPADVEELVLQSGGRLAFPDLAVELVRPVARAAGGEEVLAALLVGHVEVVPHRAPLQVPRKLRVAPERRDPAAVAAAVRPAHVAGAALVGHGPAVEVSGVGRADAPTVLADHPHRQPARVLPYVRHLGVDAAHDVGVPQDELDLVIELPRAVEVPEPVDLLGADADAREGREEALPVIAREILARLRRGDREERLPHLLGHARLLPHRLRVHRIDVVDREDVAHVEPVLAERAVKRVGDHGPA